MPIAFLRPIMGRIIGDNDVYMTMASMYARRGANTKSACGKGSGSESGARACSVQTEQEPSNLTTSYPKTVQMAKLLHRAIDVKPKL
jgi:hypothetical protein